MGASPQRWVYEIILMSYTALLKGCSLPPAGWQKGCIPTPRWVAAAEQGGCPGVLAPTRLDPRAPFPGVLVTGKGHMPQLQPQLRAGSGKDSGVLPVGVDKEAGEGAVRLDAGVEADVVPHTHLHPHLILGLQADQASP